MTDKTKVSVELEERDLELFLNYVKRVEYEDVIQRVNNQDEAYRILAILEHIKAEK